MTDKPAIVSRWASTERAFQSAKTVNILLALALLASLCLNLVQASRKQIIVGIDPAGNRTTLQATSGESGEEQLVRNAVSTLYNWDAATYEKAYREAAALMTSDLGSKLLNTLDEKTRAGIEGDSIACSLVIDSVQNSGSGVWTVTGIKTLHGRTLNRRTRVQFGISIARVAVTQSNPWGLAVSALSEQEVSQ